MSLDKSKVVMMKENVKKAKTRKEKLELKRKELNDLINNKLNN